MTNGGTDLSDLSDTSTWLPLDGLAPGFDANKAATVDDLHGCSFVLRSGDDEFAWSASEDPYEAFLVDDGLYYVQTHPGAETAYSLVLDLQRGRALVVTSTIGDTTPRLRQTFLPATIDGIEAHGEPMAASDSLIGRRALWVYSQHHAYEHIYLTPHWYTWQCLAGPERGLADTDENSTYQLRQGIYLFAWREKVIPCAAVTIADHRDARRMRSHGALFGIGEDGVTPTHFTFGAYGRLLSTTVYPGHYDGP
ncbi:MoaF C-terminal domain-containing protein [Fodinicola acaciae]|uniref:MoaF C-terminal domain-containing protein n=1 Tax=Fodinicola acaciae TaxID=2681555 RepID=UPI0013D6A95D|nr:MoaF C-terminal domain-containing protein [Fodinicola acaciae]